MLRLVLALVLLSMLCATGQGRAPEFVTKHERIRVETIATGLDHPWGLAFLPDGRKFVTERSGRLRLVEADNRLSAPLANVPPVYARGQGGLLDVVLDLSSSGTGPSTLPMPSLARAEQALRWRARLDDGRLADVLVIFRQEPKVFGPVVIENPNRAELREGKG
jgi:aldose sugar dehydrogenase